MKIISHKNSEVRILYLIGELGYGGSERQLNLVLKHLDKRRFITNVLVLNRNTYAMLDQDLQKSGTRVLFLPDNIKGMISRSRYIFGIIDKLSPDIIHSWSTHDNSYAGLVGWSAGVPVRLGSVRGSIYLPGFQRLQWYQRWLSLHSVQGLVVNSSAIAHELRENNIPSKQIHLIENAVELLSADTIPAELSLLGIESNHRLIGTVGNIRFVKNQVLFIEAMAQVITQFPDVRGLIVGQPLASEGSLPDQLANLINSLGLEGKVIMTGFRKDIPEILARFDIFCLTSNSEGTPNALLEAMSAGLPVVATRVGGVPEIIEDSVQGLLVEPGDTAGIAQAICNLLENPDLSWRMGQAGKRWIAEEFDPVKSSQKFASLYLNALQSKGLQSV